MKPEELLEHFRKVRKISTDSRKIEAGCIYFALSGSNFNGNLFASEALDKGASLVVVEELHGVSGENVLLVSDVLKTLQNLARDYRRTLTIPVLAITGSNGKTTSKELIRDVLATRYKRVHATYGNLNNHIGVPLTLLSIPTDCDFAIIEMGANHQGEIKELCHIAEPEFGFITNIGKAHLEGFGGEEGVYKGKKELFDYIEESLGLAFINEDFENLVLAGMKVAHIPFRMHTPSQQFEVISSSPELVFSYTCPEFSREYKTHLTGSYNIHNIIAAITIGEYFQIDIESGLNAVCAYIPENNRSQIQKTQNNVVIMDAYNANPSSMAQALMNLNQQKESNFFVIGDMFELGEASTLEHEEILKLAHELQLKGIAIGSHFHTVANKSGYLTFATKENAREWLLKHTLKDQIVLLKGSRGMKLEDLISAL
jgi:UDP-N-acetylmuramoyl-tripeptide--D-alanyl-D-alanine ligase